MNALLRNRNFAILFSGRLITNIGDSMYYVASMWLVYQLGGSVFFSGLAGFLTMLPQATQFVVGPIIDRYSIKKLLIVTQSAQAVLLSLIPMAYALDSLSVALVLVVMPIVAYLDQFSYPAHHALIPRIVPKQQRVAANSMMAVALQGTDAVFTAISGALVALIGAITLYSVNVVTFILCALIFTALTLPGRDTEKSSQSLGQQAKSYFVDLKEGFHIVFHSVLGKLLVASAITNFAFAAAMAVMPAYADSLGGSQSYGLLLAGLSIGGLVGASMAGLFQRAAFGWLTIYSFTFAFVFWLVSVMVPFYWLKIILFAVSMIPVGLTNVIGAAMMQNIVPERLLARVSSVNVSFSTCMMPLGSLAGGMLGSVLSPRIVFAATSLSLLFIAVYVFFVPVIRRAPSAQEVSPKDFGFNSFETDKLELQKN